MKAWFDTARALLEGGENCVLALILSSNGSTPQGEGAKMLVRGDGSLVGTIGGGPMEWAVTRQALETLADGQTRMMEFDLGSTDPAQAEAICGGNASICLYVLTGDDQPTLAALSQASQARDYAQFLLWHEGGVYRTFCLREGEQVTGTGLTERMAADIARAQRTIGVHEDPRLVFQEVISLGSRVWIMGGGHVALATAKVAAVADFEIVVVDDRAEYANSARFPDATCIVCDDYEKLPVDQVTGSDYIVVVTRGHRDDRQALDWALKTKACYVGMIGSRSKRELVYEALIKQGVPRSRLDWVHSPIGLPIGGRTPGDIAVSIVAELVSVRARLAGEKATRRG